MDALDLLFRRLVLAARAADALDRQVTVGELLDTFVPYAAARRDGGFDSNDDYLHALMRLVSGERSLLFADDLMQDDLKAELETPVPDLSALRAYGQTKVRISRAGAQGVLAGDVDIDLRPPTPHTPQPRVSVQGARSATPAAPSVPPAGTSGGQPFTDLPPEPLTELRTSDSLAGAFAAYEGSQRDVVVTAEPGCPYCAQTLPSGRAVKFCPSCGLNLLIRRCPGCSAEIESGWKFCVTCGRKA